MFTRILVLLLLQLYVFSMKVYNFVEEPNIIAEQKEELTPVLISCGLNDVVVVSAPIINNHTEYYLTSPDGDTIKLDITPTYCQKPGITEPNSSVKFFQDIQVVTFNNNYRIFSLNNEVNDETNKDIDVFREKEVSLAGNEFMIGPVSERDHGNWVLSAYYQRQDAQWIELFQVISIEIVEILPPTEEKPQLNIGDDFELSFKYPIDNLQSCELFPSASTVDRCYTRSTDNIDYCNFNVPNVTREDIGLWRIVGVGTIVYETTVYLSVKDKVT